MAVGLGRKQQMVHVRRSLKRIARELAKVGIETAYLRGGRLVFDETNNHLPLGALGFNIAFNRMNASNGECCLFPVIYINAPGHEANGNWRGWWDERTYDKGFEHIKRIFGSAQTGVERE